jgi:Putative peptidoglycan binding domain
MTEGTTLSTVTSGPGSLPSPDGRVPTAPDERDAAAPPGLASDDEITATPATAAAPAVPPARPTPPSGGLSRHRRRRRVRTTAWVGAGVIAVAAVGVASYGFGGSETPDASVTGLPPATAQVTRTTLTQTEQVNGSLGYGDPVSLAARSGIGGAAAGQNGQGGSSGTITWLPAEGTTVNRGKPAYRVDNLPVPLLYGSLPLYRVLKSGVSGPDVKQFEKNLAALGYTGFTVDEDYTDSTASAVEQWQEDLGRDETGTVDADQVAYAPSAIRITALTAHVGGPATAEVLTYTGTTRVVTLALDVSQQTLVRKGISATITLPDGRNVTGKVSSVGTVAHSAAAGQGNGGNSDPTIDVTITVANQKELGTLDAAPVDITLVSSQRKDVLTVPVAALVALAEGGYGVQVVEGGTARYVSVKTGMFAGGRVEVTGDGIDENTVVGIPK